MKISLLYHKSPVFASTEHQMSKYLLAYLNNENYRKLIRKKRPSEDATTHSDLVKHTVAMPIARYVIDTINDTVFEPGIKRNVMFATENGFNIDAETQSWSELFQLDSDLNNNTLNGVMETIGDMSGIFGHCWVAVDMPTEVDSRYARPYVCCISPLNVWDYELTNVRGAWIPEYVKVLERETNDCLYFKCYYLGTSTTPSYWESYEVEKGEADKNRDKDIIPTMVGEFPLGMSIPLFMAYTKRDPRRIDMGISDIDIATDVQSEVYKLECEAYSSIQFARTLIRADNGIKVPAQAGSIVRATQGQIESISIDQQDVNTIISKQEQLLGSFQQLTGLGGLTKTKEQVQSGVSIIEERRQLHRMAKAKARLMEIAEETIWTFASRFMNVRWAGEVNYNTDYEFSDTRYRMALIKEAQLMMPDNEIIQGLILKELVGLLAPPEEVSQYQRAIIPMMGPTTQKLLKQEDNQTMTRDIGSQTPEADPEEEDSKTDMMDNSSEGSNSIIDTGQSYTTTNAVTTMRGLGMNTGR